MPAAIGYVCGDCTSRHGNCHQKWTNKKTCCYWERLFCDTDAFPTYTLSVMWQQDGGRFFGCLFFFFFIFFFDLLWFCWEWWMSLLVRRESVKFLTQLFRLFELFCFWQSPPSPSPAPCFSLHLPLLVWALLLAIPHSALFFSLFFFVF